MSIIPPYTSGQVLAAILILIFGRLLYRSYKNGDWAWLENIAFTMLLPFWWLYQNGVAVAVNLCFVATVFILPVGLVMLLRFVGLVI